jgi:hypothetical protein
MAVIALPALPPTQTTAIIPIREMGVRGDFKNLRKGLANELFAGRIMITWRGAGEKVEDDDQDMYDFRN